MKRILSLLLCLLISAPAQAGQIFDEMFASFTADMAVVPDPALSAALLREIDDVNLWREKLGKVTSLRADSADIRDLTGLECLTGLKSLSLRGNRIKDPTPIAGLTKLSYLDLSENAIADAEPLRTLSALDSLSLSGNKLTDANPLSELRSLTYLDLSGNEIAEVSALKNLKSLGYLDLSKNRIIDVSPLSELTGLMLLDLCDNRIFNASPLNELKTRGCVIALDGNKAAEIEPAAPSIEPGSTPSPTLSPTPSPTPSPTLSPTPRPTPTPSPSPKPEKRPGGDYKYKLTNGEIEITEYKGSAEKVSIPAEIDGYPVRSIGYLAFYERDHLTNITIPYGVTKIGTGAFFSCDNLKSIIIPNSVTSIGVQAFLSCDSLTRITIPDGVTYIGEGAFSLCGKLAVVCSVDSYAYEYCMNNGITISVSYEGLFNLSRGDRGEQVTRLQNRLKTLGYYSGKADGDYGPKTESAIKRFQEAIGHAQTGVAIKETQARLLSSSAPYSK